jgi:hypothetical protein
MNNLFMLIFDYLNIFINKREIEHKISENLANNDEKTKNESKLDDEKVVEPNNKDLKTIIDNMAEYVVRNGSEFELNIKNRNEERFNFLNEDNLYYKYYKTKIIEIHNVSN